MDNIQSATIKDSNGQGFLAFCLAKKDKLTSALYLVTSFITDQEPIKWRLRDKALSIFGDIGLAKDAADLYQVAVLDKVNRSISEISSLLDVARAGGFVTEMNASVLKREYAALGQAIADRQGADPLTDMLALPVPAASPVAAKEDLSVSKPVVNSYQSAKVSVSAAHVPATRIVAPSAAGKITLRHRAGNDELPIGHSRPQSSPIVNPYHSSHQPSQKEAHNPIGQNSQNNRQESIISFIRGRGWTPISDLAEAVPGVSLKTVQRELSELVATGTLKKMGERRWSRYCLA